ncbi:MAG: hypothetical protein LBR53_00815 [Deltaproteobacteria bacterium]|jgi:hypothetical protein|nr:hypothetical protein [Deltaproteobacteria bacterium]
MSKTITRPALAALLSLMITCALPAALQAQKPFEGDIFFSLKYVCEDYDPEVAPSKYYEFLLEIERLKNFNFQTFSNMEIETNYGKIVFDAEISKDAVPKYIRGILRTEKYADTIAISKATASIDGTVYDLTSVVYPTYSSEMYVEKGDKICPYKVLDFAVKEGVFLEVVVGDYEHAVIRVGQKEEDYLFKNRLSYFFQDPSNSGKKIKFVVETSEESGVEDFECVKYEVINDFLVIK